MMAKAQPAGTGVSGRRKAHGRDSIDRGYLLGRMPNIVPGAIIVAGNGYEWEHTYQFVGKHERYRGSGGVSYT
jgi:hypothetical protein